MAAAGARSRNKAKKVTMSFAKSDSYAATRPHRAAANPPEIAWKGASDTSNPPVGIRPPSPSTTASLSPMDFRPCAPGYSSSPRSQLSPRAHPSSPRESRAAPPVVRKPISFGLEDTQAEDEDEGGNDDSDDEDEDDQPFGTTMGNQSSDRFMFQKSESMKSQEGARASRGKTVWGNIRQTAINALQLPGQDEDDGHAQKNRRHSMFADVTEMKQQIKENLCKTQYNVHDFYHESGCFVNMAKSYIFECVALCVISANAVWISIDTDWNDEPVLLAADPIFQIAENTFCALFFLEWVVRLMAFREKRFAFKDYWFLFDTVLVSMMVLETWVLSVFLAISGGQAANIGDASVLRVARLLRLTRVARLARILRAVPELMILIKGMVAATRSVFFTLVLLVSAIYIFAIAFVQISADSYVGAKYFKTTPDAMFTLLLRGAYLDEVTEFVEDLKLHDFNWLLIALFLLFVLLAAQTLMNMLIGVLCEVVSVVAAGEKEERQMNSIVSRLGFILEDLDEDGDRAISRDEFLQLMNHPEAAEALHEFGVDPISLVDLAPFLFPAEDEEGEECEPKDLSFEDFIDVVLQFRGSNSATVKDLLDSQHNIRLEIKKHGNLLFQKIDKQLHKILKKVESQTCSIEASGKETQKLVRKGSAGYQRKKTPDAPQIKILAPSALATVSKPSSPSCEAQKPCTIVEPESEGSRDSGAAAKKDSSKQEHSLDAVGECSTIAEGTGCVAELDVFLKCLQETIVDHCRHECGNLKSRLGLTSSVKQLVDKHLISETSHKKSAGGAAGLGEARLLKEQVFSLHSKNNQLQELLDKITSSQTSRTSAATVVAAEPVMHTAPFDAFKNTTWNCAEAGGDAAAGTWEGPGSMCSTVDDDALEFFIEPTDSVHRNTTSPSRPATAPACRKFCPAASGSALRDAAADSSP